MPPLVPATVSARVPLPVTGEPDTDIKPPVNVCATLVTAVDQVPSPRKKLVLLGVPVTGLVAGLATLLNTYPELGNVTLVVAPAVNVIE